MIVVCTLVVVLVALLGLAAYGITHLETDDVFGAKFSPAEQHHYFCSAMSVAGSKALPSKLLAGSGRAPFDAETDALYQAVVLFNDNRLPVALRSDYHKFLAEMKRRQQPGATGRRDDSAVLKVDQAIRACLNGH